MHRFLKCTLIDQISEKIFKILINIIIINGWVLLGCAFIWRFALLQNGHFRILYFFSDEALRESCLKACEFEIKNLKTKMKRCH